jgi:hypothetical protein
MKKLLYTIFFIHLTVFAHAQVVTNGLLAYYMFSGNAADSSGNFLDGAIHGSPVVTNDKLGHANGAYFFNGNTDYINIPSPNLTTNSYSYAAWVKPSTNDGLGFVISIGSDTAYQALLISPFQDGWTGGEYLSNGDNSYQTAGVNIDTSHWYHVVLTRDNSKIQLFVDGHKYDAVPVSGAPVYGKNPTANIAKRAGSASQYFHGAIDEVRIYNRVLTDSEVQTLYSVIKVQGIKSSLADNIFTILPNPNNGSFAIDLSSKLNNCEINIQNSYGEVVYSEKLGDGFGRKEITIGNHAQGMYLLTIKADEGLGSKKIVIQ